MRNSILLASLAFFAACGGGPGTGPVSQADAEDGCRRDCEHDKTCDPSDPTTVEECTADCVADVTTGWVRADAFEAIVDCRAALACTANDDACLEECTPTSAHNAYEAQCREVFATCGTAEQIDGICEVTPSAANEVGFWCLITPSIVNEMTACIPDGTSCEASATCIQGVLEAHNINN